MNINYNKDCIILLLLVSIFLIITVLSMGMLDIFIIYGEQQYSPIPIPVQYIPSSSEDDTLTNMDNCVPIMETKNYVVLELFQIDYTDNSKFVFYNPCVLKMDDYKSKDYTLKSILMEKYVLMEKQ